MVTWPTLGSANGTGKDPAIRAATEVTANAVASCMRPKKHSPDRSQAGGAQAGFSGQASDRAKILIVHPNSAKISTLRSAMPPGRTSVGMVTPSLTPKADGERQAATRAMGASPPWRMA
jgi:hypothetical protein